MKKSLFMAAFSTLFALPTWAHAPFLDCSKSGKIISCIGGFSDGSSAEKTPISVRSYDEKELFKGQLDKEGKISFPVPEGEFYVRFEGGAGHVVEVDYNDIEETPPTSKSST